MDDGVARRARDGGLSLDVERGCVQRTSRSAYANDPPELFLPTG